MTDEDKEDYAVRAAREWLDGQLVGIDLLFETEIATELAAIIRKHVGRELDKVTVLPLGHKC